jgi:hypothetical protein
MTTKLAAVKDIYFVIDVDWWERRPDESELTLRFEQHSMAALCALTSCPLPDAPGMFFLTNSWASCQGHFSDSAFNSYSQEVSDIPVYWMTASNAKSQFFSQTCSVCMWPIINLPVTAFSMHHIMGIPI